MTGCLADRSIEVIEKPWDDQASRLIKRLGESFHADALKKQVDEKRVTLYEVVEGEGEGKISLGIFFLRVDTLITGRRELVVMHGISEVPAKTHLSSVLGPFFDEIARSNDIQSVRIHSSRKGLDPLLEASGYEFIENVYRKTLSIDPSGEAKAIPQAPEAAVYCIYNRAAGRMAPRGEGLTLEEATRRVGENNAIYEVRRMS